MDELNLRSFFKMGYLKYVRKAWRQPRKNLGSSYKEKLICWRREKAIVRVERPTRIDKARSLGYKAKHGFVVARVRVLRSMSKNPKIRRGRDGGNLSTRIAQSKNYKWIAEERVAKRFPNLEVLNSYWVGEDERHYWFEVILIDVYHTAILNDNDINWIVSRKHTKRASRGLTSSGKKARGLRKKGFGTEKARPSLRANNRRLR